MKSRAIKLIIALGAFVATGCAAVPPWDRADLAHQTMSVSDDAGPGEGHLRAITEGAIGGTTGAGSGCGCN
jgi:hypothetical protein